MVNETLSLLDLAQTLAANHPQEFKLPTRELPKWLIWLIAPTISRTRRYIKDNINIRIAFDNRKSRENLGLNYRPVSETLVDQVNQLLGKNNRGQSHN